VIIGDAFTDIAVPPHLVTQEFFELVRDRLSPDGLFLMNVIDFEHRMDTLAALYATMDSVFPHVEVWTEQRRPEPEERMVFVLAASGGPGMFDSLELPSPEPTRYGVLADGFIQSLVAAKSPVILTDDYAPIDRLLGPG